MSDPVDSTAPSPRWLAVVTTEPGAGFLVRWRSLRRAIDAHPPALAAVALGDEALSGLDAAELECVTFAVPFSGGEHEVIPNGLLRFAAVAGLAPKQAVTLRAHIVFAAADGTVAVEGEDYEVVRAPPLRAVLAPDAEEPTE